LDLQVLDQPVLLVQILVQAVDFPCREDVRADQAGDEQEKKKAAERKSKSWHGGDRMVVDGFILPDRGSRCPLVPSCWPTWYNGMTKEDEAMFRYSLARLMGVILVVAITLGAVRFFGPTGLVVAIGAFLGSLLPVLCSKRRGLDPTLGFCSVLFGVCGVMIGINLVRPSELVPRQPFDFVGALLSGMYWVVAVWVRLTDDSALPEDPQCAKPSKYLVFAGLALVCGPFVPAILYAFAKNPWNDLRGRLVQGLVVGLLFAVPCFLAWLIHVTPRRQGPLPPQSPPP